MNHLKYELRDITENDYEFIYQVKKIAYISNNKLYITNGEFIDKLTIGSSAKGYYDEIVRSNKHLTLKYRKS